MDNFFDLFLQGQQHQAYLQLGAIQQNDGYNFTVYAPNALYVAVVGDFNSWDNFANPLAKNSQGFWSGFIAPLGKGELYKYCVITAEFNILLKADPFALKSQLRPHTSSITWSGDFAWQDQDWLKQRNNGLSQPMPLNIYELHLGSWKKKGKGENDFYSYRELAPLLVDYLRTMGYTHLEVMPLAEHPFDGSWGYQGTGYFSVTSRYGNPEDLMYLIDYCHQNNIGVIMDWVCGHFCKDIQGLGNFDGTKLYEGGEHSQWGTYRFDFNKPFVWSFLSSNACFWLAQFHIDGIRVDGVTSILYEDFGQENGSNIIDQNAVRFLQTLNQTVGRCFPSVMMIAEESSPYPLITYPPEVGGLGFHYKWNMGWMNDTLKYMEKDFSARSQFHNLLTFPMMYAFTENFILPLSHDEVVHGKKSLISKMPGNYEQQFAGAKVLMAYQMTHPGSKLSFMGNEFAQFIEWKYSDELDWFLLEYEKHQKFQVFIKELNHIYLQEPCLWQEDRNWSGFSWLEANDSQQNILMFQRWSGKEYLTIIINFSPVTYEKFRVGVESDGLYREISNSDWWQYGGNSPTNNAVQATAVPFHGKEYSVELKLPALTCLMLKGENNVIY